MAADPTHARPSAGPRPTDIDRIPAADATRVNGSGPRARRVNDDEERSTMSIEIRPFTGTEDEYEAIIAIENDVYPEYPATVEEWQHWDRNRDAKLHFERVVAYDGDGRAVAFGAIQHYAFMYHPRKLGLGISVRSDRQRQGVGSQLYRHLRERAERFDPITFWSDAREDYASGRGFLEGKGFREVQREWENHLDLEGFDPTRFAGAVERVEASGIRLATYGQLLEEDPDFWRKAFELSDAVGRDVPSPDEHTTPDFDAWVTRVKKNPNLVPEGYFIAVDGDRYVGVSNLWTLKAEPETIETGLTGVRREHRRRGIALALKLKALGWAKDQGYRKVKTWNERGNEGMLAINEMLGFVKQPAWISYALQLQPDPDVDATKGEGETAAEVAATPAGA